ncbi:thymidylate synthase [Indivirus ILV1]|uniref:thymidylate synthase n=1 Tax=Indivirus ILV1 TaxID=1977633 RepID=A0A1V0SD48_9VIRU|nr:thymidylate synthase [Indivirus ILV1]
MESRIPIALIVAIDIRNGISKNNTIPWKIKEDSNFFQDVTKRQYEKNKSNAVIMGKNTWKALPDDYRGLKDRINIIVSSTMNKNELDKDNMTGTPSYIVPTLEKAINLCQNELDLGKIFICGGSHIYEEAIVKHQIDEFYITKIYHDFLCTNQFPIELIIHNSSHYMTNFKLHKSTLFKVADQNTNKLYDVEFCKYYNKDIQLPKHFMNTSEHQYLDLMEYVLKNGHFRQTRNSKTWSVFGKTLEFDLGQGFPILSTKKLFFRGVFEELLFFLKGDTNAQNLSEKGVKIWDLNTTRGFLDSVRLNHYDVGDMGPMYGFQFRHHGIPYRGMNEDYNGLGFDQIDYCLNLLKTDPYSRRIVMTSFNPAQAREGVLYPCHSLVIQFYVENNNKLSASVYNRSQDYLLGSPFNLCMAGLLVHMFCEVINNDPNYKNEKYLPGRLIMNLGDVHIYEDHYSESIRQILRDPYDFPKLIFNRKVIDLTDFKYEDLELLNYECYPNIIAKMIA